MHVVDQQLLFTDSKQRVVVPLVRSFAKPNPAFTSLIPPCMHIGTCCCPLSADGAWVLSPRSGQTENKRLPADKWWVNYRESGLKGCNSLCASWQWWLLLPNLETVYSATSLYYATPLWLLWLLPEILPIWKMCREQALLHCIHFAIQGKKKGVSPMFPSHSFLQRTIVSALTYQLTCFMGIFHYLQELPVLHKTTIQCWEQGTKIENQ